MHGRTLIEILLFIIFAGLMMVGVTKMTDLYFKIERPEITRNNLDSAYNSLLAYYAKTGEYPCPAAINAPMDSSKFGISVNSCLNSSNGIEIVNGGGSPVAIGALPTRTLGIPDEWGFDSYSKRISYAITAGYTDANNSSNKEGAIQLVDRNKNIVTNAKRNVIFTLIGHGEENQGAYSFDGILVEPCDPSSFFGENCDGDNVFAHSASATDVGKETYVSKIRYKAEDPACEPKKDAPRQAGFLLDTSGSMKTSSYCPPESNSGCTRMKLALWALHRTMAARMDQIENSSDGAFTGFSEFTGSSTTAGALEKMKNNNVEVKGKDDIEKRIYKACPGGLTPLGVHIEAMAEIVADGDEDKPNVITVISDGRSNQGTDPIIVANRIKETMPNLRVNIVDVHGTPELEEIAEITGGEYFRTDKPDEILDALLTTIGVCPEKELPLPSVNDQEYCQE